MYLFNKTKNRKIEKAIRFATARIKRDDKPVVFHSLKIAFYLLSQDYPTEVIVAAILHDLVEDSDCTIKKIEEGFGKRVARLVQAVTFDPKIKDSTERYREMFNRINRAGKKALVLKAVDIFDNSHFYSLVKSSQKRQKLLKKGKYFLMISKKKIGQTQAWKDLKSQLEKLEREL